MHSKEKLRILLESVSDSYFDFVRGVLYDCERFKHKNPVIENQLIDFIENNPTAESSEILSFESVCIGIPYFDDSDGKWHRWDKIISEEEARAIVQKEYCDD